MFQKKVEKGRAEGGETNILIITPNRAIVKVAKTQIEDLVACHHPGVTQTFDVALCGQDLSGDSWLGWEAAEVVDGVIDCEDCLRIIHACRELQESDLSPATEVA